MSFIFLVYFVSSLFTYLLVASSHQSRLLKINAIVTIANLLGNAIAIPYYSFIGSAVVTLVCQLILLFLTYRATKDIIRFDFLPKTTVSYVFASILASYLLRLASERIFPFFANSFHS